MGKKRSRQSAADSDIDHSKRPTNKIADVHETPEMLHGLTEDERLVCGWLRLGFSITEIAKQIGKSTDEVAALVAAVRTRARTPS
jgi:hypothetical protein